MSGPRAAPGLMRIGDWRVDASSGVLNRDDEQTRVEPRVMAVLLDLAAHAGQVRAKDDILQAVWADTYVGEAALSRCISELRRILGDDARDPTYIETLPKRGYRLVAKVSTLASDAASLPGQSLPDHALPGQPSPEPKRPRWQTLVAAAIVMVLFWAWWRSMPEPATGGVELTRPVPAEARSALDRGRLLAAHGAPVDAVRSLDQFRRALDIDPEYALAWALMADVQATLAWHNWSNPSTAYAEARDAAHRALDLDPTLPDAHAVLAAVAAERNQDWPEAERRFRTAVALEPQSAFALERYGRYQRRVGRAGEAVASTRAALVLEPDSIPIAVSHAWSLVLIGRLREARGLLESALDLDDAFGLAYSGLCAIDNLEERFDAARGSCARAAAMPGHELELGPRAYAEAGAGDEAAARATLVELEQLDATDAALAIATAYMGLGDQPAAIAALELAEEHRALWLPALLENPYLRPLRNTPRVRRILDALLIPTASDE